MKTAIQTLFFFIGMLYTLDAQPNLSSRETMEGTVLYGDLKSQTKFYYVPKGIHLGEDADGKPNFSFARMTYIPSRARGMENWKQTSVLQFTVKKTAIDRSTLQRLKKNLKARSCAQCSIDLVPIPIRKMEAALIYTDLDADSTQILPQGYANTKKGLSQGIWSSKTFTVRPQKYTSQALWDAFKKNKGLLSVAYSIWTKGHFTDHISYDYQAPEEHKELFEQLHKRNTPGDSSKLQATLVHTGVFHLDLDLKKWPALLKEIDLGSTLSPRYGLIDIYCHDFNNNIRPDLIGKIVEFEAQGVGNGPVKAEVDFKKNTPDLYAQALKFEYAVRLDKPFRYRVTEITESGEVHTGQWLTKENWSHIIDVSSHKDFETTLKNAKQ
ncbi:hypothetical protein [Spongiimicrobium salis]|uniref:hypothetical protein n=1 Tax=Spongiimicrobium salis TaxID=1667022 RepID=UPI00374D77A8